MKPPVRQPARSRVPSTCDTDNDAGGWGLRPGLLDAHLQRRCRRKEYTEAPKLAYQLESIGVRFWSQRPVADLPLFARSYTYTATTTTNMASPVQKRHPDNPVVFFDITLGGKLSASPLFHFFNTNVSSLSLCLAPPPVPLPRHRPAMLIQTRHRRAPRPH